MSPSLTAAVFSLAAIATPVLAQTPPIPVELPSVYSPPEPGSAGKLTDRQLDQLLAPVALYPDTLLTDVLAASTYPTQIVEAQRFASDPANANLQGSALMDAASAHHWDPSVQALLPFPMVLNQLNADLEWTDRLGQAFMAQQADVLDAVQRLRQRAEAAGTLANGPQDEVVNEGGDVAILPPSDQQVYVPTYDASCVYGAGCGDDSVFWGDALWLPYGYSTWGVLDWGHRRIEYNGSHHGGAPGRGWETAAGTGGIWHHAGAAHIAFNRAPGEIGGLTRFQADGARIGSVTGGEADESFNYAAPAGQRFGQGGFGTAPIMPRPITPAGFGRGRAFIDQGRGQVGGQINRAAPARAAAPVALAHGGGGFGGGGHR